MQKMIVTLVFKKNFTFLPKLGENRRKNATFITLGPGTDVIIFQVFSQKNRRKIAVFDSKKLNFENN
jgi:hypothetical protein